MAIKSLSSVCACFGVFHMVALPLGLISDRFKDVRSLEF